MTLSACLHSRRALAAAGALALAAYWLALGLGVDSTLVTRWGFLALLAVPTALVLARAATVREDRFAWTALGTGLTLWTAGFVWQAIAELRGATPTFPGPADALWLAAYPFPLLAMVVFARPWLRRAPTTLLLEMLLVVLGTSAVVTWLVLPPVAANATRLDALAQAANFAYPLIDGVLLSVAIIGAAVAGRRPGSPWALIALGAMALVAGDALWALRTADGTWATVMGSNALFPLWPALVAAAAYLPERGRRRILVGGQGARTHAATLVAVSASILLLVINEWVAVPATSIVLAALALVTAVHRSALTLAASLRETLVAGRERELVDDVRLALERGELELHYQPLVDAADGTVKGAEALLRWHRDGVYVAPDSYLPAVERSDLIRPLTDYVIDRALRAAAHWRGEGHLIGVSVNLATANLSEADLPGRVLNALRRHDLPPSALTLEITETAAVEDNALADHVLRALDDLGVGIAVDDFGTGHSSLVRLARFPICELKIDRSFVKEMHSSRQPIVATAIQIAHTLGLRVVAEGVEDQAALDALCDLGCDLAQGYFISRPVPQADFEGWLQTAAASPRVALTVSSSTA